MTQSGRGHSSSSRNLDSFLLKVGLLVAVAAFTLASAEATPARDSGLNRWLTRSVPDESDRIVQADVGSDDQGETEYLDAVILREGLNNGQVEPKKKPIQVRLPFYDGIRNRRRLLINNNNAAADDDRFYAKRDLNGMSMSITHNLDILRRGLLRELSLRQREQDRRHLMENNKKFLTGIGRRRRR